MWSCRLESRSTFLLRSLITRQNHAKNQGAKLLLELGLIQTQMAQKPMLRAELYARASRASKNVRGSGDKGGRAMRLMSGRGVGECGCGRHSYGGGVISKVGWLSVRGAPRGVFV